MNEKTAQQLAQEGIDRAVSHADRVIEHWSDLAYEFFLLSILNRPGKQFRTEQPINHAESHNIPKPPDNRAWGAVIQRGAKAGFIKKVGYEPGTNPTAHGRPVTVWEVTNG